MSKPIRMTPELVEEMKQSFAEALQNAKVMDGKFSFTKTLADANRKATLVFTEKAWMKMNLLITYNNTEVAWHGIAHRGDDDTYTISDILVYPQEVDGTNVNTDQEKYQTWLMSQPDEIFFNLRMQGHSHVNMSTFASSVDLAHQEKILGQMKNDMFYIFLIWNKKGEKFIRIYDLAKNVLFETADVNVKIDEEEDGYLAFMREAKGLVADKPKPTYAYSGYNDYGGYYGNTGYYGSQKASGSAKTASVSQPAKAAASAASTVKDETSGSLKKGKRFKGHVSSK